MAGRRRVWHRPGNCWALDVIGMQKHGQAAHVTSFGGEMSKGRLVTGLLVVGGLLAQRAPAALLVRVSVSYYDTEHASPTKPDPWLGSPNTTFFGAIDPTSGIFDTGGIMFSNQGS